MDLIIWTYIFGGATVFGVIVGIFSVYNGRMTRRELSEVIERGNEGTHNLLERMNGRMEKMAESTERVDERIERLAETMSQMAVYMQDMDKRHTELLSRMGEKTL